MSKRATSRKRVTVVSDSDEEDGQSDVRLAPSAATVAPLTSVVPKAAKKREVDADDDTESKPRAPRQEGQVTAHAQINDVNVVSVFGPRFVATDEVMDDPKTAFASGYDTSSPYSDASNPIKSLQVLIHTAGDLIGENERSLLKSYSTFPVAPSSSPAEGQLILYSVYRLFATNTPAGGELASALWAHYRTSLSSYLGVRLPQLQSDLRRLDDRFAVFPWGQLVSTLDSAADAMAPALGALDAKITDLRGKLEKSTAKLRAAQQDLVKGASGADRKIRNDLDQEVAADKRRLDEAIADRLDQVYARAFPDESTFTVFADTPHWLLWIEESSRLKKLLGARGANRRLSAVDVTTLLKRLGGTAASSPPPVYDPLIGVARAEPRDLASLLGITVRPATAIGLEPQLVVPDSLPADVRTAVDQVTGKRKLAIDVGSNVFDALLAAYSKLATHVSKTTPADGNSAWLYVFAYVWLPLRTGIGFDGGLGAFRARPISYSLIGHTGLLPLLGSALYATESSLGSSPLVFTLAHELIQFHNSVRMTTTVLPNPGSIRAFVSALEPGTVARWATTRHTTVNSFRRTELPLLSTLFFVANQAAANKDGAVNAAVSPWLSAVLSAAVWTQPVAQLPVEQRTADSAFALYQAAAERVDAPPADRVVSTEPPDTGVNYAEFGGTAAFYLMNTLISRPTSDRPLLLLVVGAALGRLGAMLAYKHPALWCACVPVTAVSNTAAAGLRPNSTDWITPIVDEMATLSGDSSLRRRVFVMSQWTLMEHHERGADIYRDAVARVSNDNDSAAAPKVFMVGNSLNGALQFDVPETLFAELFSTLLSGVRGAVPSGSVVDRFTTFSLGGNTERRLALAATSAPLAPLLAEYGVDSTTVYYAGEIPVEQTGALTAPEVGAEQRRRAMLRALAPGGANETLYKALRDALSDASLLLTSDLAATAPLFHRVLLRVAVLAVSVNRFRDEGLIGTAVPDDIVRSIADTLAGARAANVDQALVDSVEAQINRGNGMQTQSVLGQLLASMEADRQYGSTMQLPRVVRDGDGEAKVQIDAKPSTRVVVLALERLNRSRMEDGTRCVEVLADWSRAIFELAEISIADYRDNYWKTTDPASRTALLEERQQQVATVHWPRVAACLDDLVRSGDDDVRESDASLQVAYGPALLYAQLINTTLVVAQRLVEAFQTDLRAGRAVDFRHQESPFLAWFGLQANATQETIARLADLLFRDSRWLMPLMPAGSRGDTGGYIALRSRATLIAHQCAKLLLSADYYKEYKDRLKRRQAQLLRSGSDGDDGGGQARRGLSDVADADDPKELEAMRAQLDQQRRQFERVTDAFALIGDLFRAQSGATRIPMSFFVGAVSEFFGDADTTEQQVRPLMRRVMSTTEQQVNQMSAAASLAGTGKTKLDLVMSSLEEMFQQLAFAYVAGGYPAVMSTLSGTDLRREVVTNVQEEALRTEDVWKLDLEFEPDDPELDLVFPVPDDAPPTHPNRIARTVLTEWLRMFDSGTDTPSPARRVRDDLIAIYEVTNLKSDADPEQQEDDGDTEVDLASARRYLVLTPGGTSQTPSDQQIAFIRTYKAADRMRELRTAKNNLETFMAHHQRINRIVESGEVLTADNADPDVLREFYNALVTDPVMLEDRSQGTLTALSLKSDDHWLKAAVGPLVPLPEEPPAFLLKQLSDSKSRSEDADDKAAWADRRLEEAIAINPFSAGGDTTKTVLRNYLHRAYAALAQPQDSDYHEWRRRLLVPVPSFAPLTREEEALPGTTRVSLDATEWSMNFRWLRDVMEAEAHLFDADSITDKQLAAEWQTNAVFQALLKSTLPVETKKHLEAAPTRHKRLALQFARFYTAGGEQRETARRWWTEMTKNRLSGTELTALDAFEPTDDKIITPWVDTALGEATPVFVREAIAKSDSLQQRKQRNLAVFARMLDYAAQKDADPSYRGNLLARMNEAVARAKQTAVREGIYNQATGVVSLPSFDDVRRSESLARTVEAFMTTRIVIATEQRRVWRSALGRLFDAISAKAAPSTVAWWVRARASSWSQRLRMVLPEMRNSPAWPQVIEQINRLLATYEAQLTEVPRGKGAGDLDANLRIRPANSALVVTADEIKKRVKEYEKNTALVKNLRTQSADRSRVAANLLYTVLEPLGSLVASRELAIRYAGAVSNTVDKLALDRIVLAASTKIDQLAKTRQQEASEAAQDRQEAAAPAPEEREDVPPTRSGTGEPILELFTGRLQDPVARFDHFVLSDEAGAMIHDRLVGAWGNRRTDEAAVWADLTVWLSRHVQFVDAERNRTMPRVTASGRTSVRDFVASVMEAAATMSPAQFADQLQLLVVNRLVNDSLLYADLDSLQRPVALP